MVGIAYISELPSHVYLTFSYCLVAAYIRTLEKCAFEADTEDCSDRTADSEEILDSAVTLSTGGSGGGGELPTLRQRLIITLSNCHYSLAKVMPRLVETLDKHGYHETNKVSLAATGLDQGFISSIVKSY